MITNNKKSGFVLIITLIIMIALSLMSIPAFRVAMVNLQIINNAHDRDILQSKVSRAIERMVHDESGNNYIMPTASIITIDGQDIIINKPSCVATKPATGYSVDDEIPPEDTIWEVTATGQSKRGSSVSILQGLRIRMLAGSCI